MLYATDTGFGAPASAETHWAKFLLHGLLCSGLSSFLVVAVLLLIGDGDNLHAVQIMDFALSR
jgi:hypothetical protein